MKPRFLFYVASMVLRLVTAASPESSTAIGKPDDILRWLPPDTETLIFNRGPFVFPKLQPEDRDKAERPLVAADIERLFRYSALAWFSSNQAVSSPTEGRVVLWAAEGSRHSRQPTSLGLMPYEGCTVAVFEKPIGPPNSFIGSVTESDLRLETIKGVKVAVFQKKLEDDVWTFFIAQPTPTVLLAATDRNYLTDVLERITHATRHADRALPATLPEWKHVDVLARFWAVRHYDKSQKGLDPLSGLNDGPLGSDEKAVGMTFSFNPAKSRNAVVTYLSADTHLQSRVEELKSTIRVNSFGMDPQAAAALIPAAMQNVSGVYRLEFKVTSFNALAAFEYMLDLWLGHGVLA